MRTPPSVVLFDLDNTLVHRGESIAAYARCFFAHFGERLSDHDVGDIYALAMKQDNGGYLPADSAFKSIRDAVASGLFEGLAWKDRPDLEELRTHWSKFDVEHTTEMPGASTLVDYICDAGLRIGVISNGKHASRMGRIERLPFGKHVALVLSSEKAGVKKPDSGIFQMAAAELGVRAEDCWYIGDHPINDVQGAGRAGMQAVWLSGFHAWPHEYPAPQLTVSSLVDVIPLLSERGVGVLQ